MASKNQGPDCFRMPMGTELEISRDGTDVWVRVVFDTGFGVSVRINWGVARRIGQSILRLSRACEKWELEQ